jgi:hypothetical protein
VTRQASREAAGNRDGPQVTFGGKDNGLAVNRRRPVEAEGTLGLGGGVRRTENSEGEYVAFHGATEVMS